MNKAYYERALLHFQMEMFEEAADDCTLACARVIEGCKYSSIDILNHRARTYFEAGKFRKAIRDFDTLLNDENHKSDFMLYIKRGQSHLALDKHEDAENDFKEAIKINPKTVEGYFNLALLYQTKKNDSLNAMVCYSKTLLLYPKNLQDADKTKEHLDSERKLREIAASGDPAAIYYLMKGILLEDKLQTIKEIQISVPKMGSTLWSLYLHEEIHQALTELEKKTPLTQFSFVANALMASAAEKEKQANDQARLRDFDDHEKASVKNTDVLLGDISTFLGSEEISSRFRKAILEHLLKISPLMTVLFGAAKENWPKINQENCGRKIYEAIGKFIPLSIEQITEVVPSKHSLNI